MMAKPLILVVDDQPQNVELLEAYLVPLGYEIVKAANGAEALAGLSGHPIDLILLDVMMPGMDGFEVIRRVRQNQAYQRLPIILVSALRETGDRVKGIEAGCDDFLSKPVDKLELLTRVRSLLKVKAYNDLMGDYRKELESEVTRRTEELKQTLETLRQDVAQRILAEEALKESDKKYRLLVDEDMTNRKKEVERIRKALRATVQAIAVTAETRDPYTAGHQRRVADLARAIALEMNLPLDMIDGIHMAAAIHDLGKISVPAEILSKPTKLLDIEFMLIKTHSQCGYDILKDIDFPWPVARTVLEHHERMNGSGYPNGLMGDEILMEARILSVADVVESMASHRPYRPALGIKAALNEISKNKGILYDPGASEACLRLFQKKDYQLIA